MTTIINGSSPSVTFSDGTTQTTAGLPLTGGTVTGNVTINGNIIQGANTAPCFAAYSNVTQSIATGTSTVVTFNNKLFDTNTNYSTSTNRFTPTVAGYYKFNTTIRLSGTSPSQYIVYWYKNGSSIGIPCFVNTTISSPYISSASTLVYMNGTSDYFEVYANITATSPTFGSTAPNTNYFSGCLVRSA